VALPPDFYDGAMQLTYVMIRDLNSRRNGPFLEVTPIQNLVRRYSSSLEGLNTAREGPGFVADDFGIPFNSAELASIRE
jgi:hypothetical protein